MDHHQLSFTHHHQLSFTHHHQLSFTLNLIPICVRRPRAVIRWGPRLGYALYCR